MRIARIDRMHRYRIFRDFEWSGELEDFARFNVIYGWNGSGKTAISDLFRGAQNRQYIPNVDVRIVVAETVVHANAFHESVLPQVRVFNRDSIGRNVFELASVELPAVYVFGENSVEKQKEVEALKKEVAEKRAAALKAESRRLKRENELDTHCVDRARAIKNLLTLPGGGPYNTYDKSRYRQRALQLISESALPDGLTESKRQEYLNMRTAVTLPEIPLLELGLPESMKLTAAVRQMLEKEIANDAIAQLVESPSLAQWVHQGLSFHDQDGGECKFCGETLSRSRLDRLRAHFNDEFQKFQAEIEKQIALVGEAIEKLKAFSAPPKEAIYPHLQSEYSAQLAKLKQGILYLQIFFSSILSALLAKKAEPLKRVELLPFLGLGSTVEPEGGWIAFLRLVLAGISVLGAKSGEDAYGRVNQIIEKHNAYTKNFADEVRQARERLELDEVVGYLSDFRRRLDAVQEARRRTESINTDIKNLTSKSDLLESEIRQHQKPAEELTREMAAYLGRADLKFEVRDTGYVISRNGEPALHLSEGERTAIAFMHFLKSLSDSSFDAKNGVVVIDDPISSLDINSLYSAFGFMRARTAEVGQLFVLTHNFLFFRQVRNWFHQLRGQEKKERRFYMLRTVFAEDGLRRARIAPMDRLLQEYESEYHYLFKRVHEEASASGAERPLSTMYELPNIGRRLLEAFLAFRVPGDAGKLYRQFDRLNIDAARKARVIRFCDTYSHHEQIGEEGQDFSLLAEAPSVLADILAIIQEVDPLHYEGMKAIVTEPAT